MTLFSWHSPVWTTVNLQKAAHRRSFMKCNMCMYKEDWNTDHRKWLKRSLLTKGDHIKKYTCLQGTKQFFKLYFYPNLYNINIFVSIVIRGQIFSPTPTSLQTHNILIPSLEGAFLWNFWSKLSSLQIRYENVMSLEWGCKQWQFKLAKTIKIPRVNLN